MSVVVTIMSSVRRRDGDVWGPFYEQPFARSGEGTAWEGLSKYDLNRPNAWYWNRLKQFAEKGAEKGLLLFHENYFQHNILEAGAYWVDCPWRSANNINQTDMPEPVPFAGDKRIFVADMFYDTVIRYVVSFIESIFANAWIILPMMQMWYN